MNNALLRFLFPVLILAAGVAFTLALSPSAVQPGHPSPAADSNPAALAAPTKPPTKAAHAPTPTPTPEPVSQPGSTDGIVIMSFAIAVIIVTPILLQHRLWMS